VSSTEGFITRQNRFCEG